MASEASGHYERAADAERRAWEALEDALPGAPGFNAARWDEWRAALRRAREALAEAQDTGKL